MAVMVAVGLGGLATIGCTTRPAISTSATSAKGTRADADELTLALDSLRKLAEGGEAQPHDRTVFYLNQWISKHKGAAAGDWEPDRLLSTLPRALRITPGLEELEKLQFTVNDVPYLQQTLWLHDVAQRVRREPAPPRLQAWFKTMESEVGLPESEQLAAAERLFDWTIRNIQLDPLPPAPKQAVATAGTGEQLPPAALGEEGPGYANMPMQTLLYGHGDAHERARIFIQLCRQAGVEAVMLGLPQRASAEVVPWIPAVFVGNELYLFDTSLGLPIPGPGGEGIATLDEATSDPAVLRQLDLPDQPYPLNEDSFKLGVVALFDAEPSSLARRMQLLQDALPASRRLMLATRPSELEGRVRQSKPISQGMLWRVAFDALLYQGGRMYKLQQDPEAMTNFQKHNMVFAFGTPLVQGRNLHLQGRFEKVDQEPGARSYYLDVRVPDAELDVIKRSKFVREKVGLQQQLPEDPTQQTRAIESITDTMRQRKQNATYWISLTYYESGNYKAAVEWLTERTLETVPPSPWMAGARYNLARCYEQIGQHDLARRWLESDADSPQRHGNLLRAKWLASQEGEQAVVAEDP